MATATEPLAIDPHTPWSGDLYHQTRTLDGHEYHLVKHARRDGHVSANGWYLSSHDAGLDRYAMGSTPKRARERFHLEFVEGWAPTHQYGRGGQALFQRDGQVEGYSDLLLDLRKRVGSARREAARPSPAVTP